jgi:hypothetical protein
MEIGAEEFQPLHHVDRVPVQWGSIFFPTFFRFFWLFGFIRWNFDFTSTRVSGRVELAAT